MRITVTDIQTVNDPETSDKNIVEIYWIFENISQKEHFLSDTRATAYVNDVSVSSAFNSIHYNQRIKNIDLAAGKRTEGYYCVEVPKDAKQLEVRYCEKYATPEVNVTFVFDIPPA